MMVFFIKDLFSKCDQIRRKQRIWSYLLKKSLMENFIVCAVAVSKEVSVHWFANQNAYSVNLYKIVEE